MKILNVVNNFKFGNLIHIEMLTEVKIPKKYGIVGLATKRSIGNVQVVTSYEKNVNDHLANEGLPTDFLAEPLPWGSWQKGNEGKVIEHNGNLYLRYYLTNATSLTANYYVDGRPATDSELAIIKDWEYSRNKGSNRQESVGLVKEKQSKPCVVNFDNIENLRRGTDEYIKPILLAV